MATTDSGMPDPGVPGPAGLLAADHPALAGTAAAGDRSAGGRSPRGVAEPRLNLAPLVQTEAQVLAAVRRYLALHPRVARLIRVNSGAAMRGDPASPRFVRFVDLEGQARLRSASKRSEAIARAAQEQMELVPDLVGFLVDGRFLAVEVKAGGWKCPRNARERAQERFLGVVRHSGGVAGFVASPRDAERLLSTQPERQP